MKKFSTVALFITFCDRTYIWSLEKKNGESYRICHPFNYKAQVQIVVAFMAIHNYIRRTSMQDMSFMEFDRHPDFVPDDFLTDVAPHSQIKGHHRPSRMDYVRDGIVASLLTQL